MENNVRCKTQGHTVEMQLRVRTVPFTRRVFARLLLLVVARGYTRQT